MLVIYLAAELVVSVECAGDFFLCPGIRCCSLSALLFVRANLHPSASFHLLLCHCLFVFAIGAVFFLFPCVCVWCGVLCCSFAFLFVCVACFCLVGHVRFLGSAFSLDSVISFA